jgi:hypothetical protein
VEIELTSCGSDTNWITGYIYHKKEVYKFEAKVFDEPSKYGIHNGRISKLWVHPKGDPGNWLINYDRGWDIKPTFGFKKVLKALTDYLEETPRRFV